MKKIKWLFLFIMVILIAGCNDNKKNYDCNIKSIEYSFHDSYGTYASTKPRHIVFNKDGKVNLSNDYDSSTATFEISEEDYIDLSNYICKRIDMFDRKPKEDDEVLDGGYSTVEIVLESGEKKSFGGYMVLDRDFNEIESKINGYLKNDTYTNYMKLIF